jgi:integrase
MMPPKSEKSKRTIELPETCIIGLRAHKVRQDQMRTLAESRWKETGHVFTSIIGTPIDDGKILKEFNALVKAGGLPKTAFTICATPAYRWCAQGVLDKVIADVVGHSDIRLTQNVYQHVYGEAKRAAAATMEAQLTGLANTPESRVATKSVPEGLIRTYLVDSMEPPAGIEPATC